MIGKRIHSRPSQAGTDVNHPKPGVAEDNHATDTRSAAGGDRRPLNYLDQRGSCDRQDRGRRHRSGGKGGGVPILAEPLKLVMPLVVLFVSWEVHVLAAHDPMFVVMA